MTNIPSSQRKWTEEEQQLLDNFKKLEGFTIERRNIENENSRHFVIGADTHKRFDYYLFINKEKRKLVGLIHFGTNIQGPEGCVHGGAIATMIDGTMGICLWDSDLVSVTVNLNVNYKKFIPLGTTVVAECEVEKVEGRKVFVKCIFKNLKGDVIHNEGTGIFVLIDYEKMKEKYGKK